MLRVKHIRPIFLLHNRSADKLCLCMLHTVINACHTGPAAFLQSYTLCRRPGDAGREQRSCFSHSMTFCCCWRPSPCLLASHLHHWGLLVSPWHPRLLLRRLRLQLLSPVLQPHSHHPGHRCCDVLSCLTWLLGTGHTPLLA